MFLIEFAEGSFINAEYIQWVEVRSGMVSFTVTGESVSIFKVAPSHQKSFLNNLQHLNRNIHNIENRYVEVNP